MSEENNPPEPDQTQFVVNRHVQPDPELAELKAELAAFKESNQALLKQLKDYEADKQKELYQNQRAAKMSELKKIDPRLAKKHNEEVDLGKIDLLIETAKSYKSDFPEYKDDEDKDNKKKTSKVVTHINPITGDME